MAEHGDELRLGWLGTGRMGSELVQRLLAAGCDVAVYNRTRAKAEPLAALGAKIVSSPAELGTRDIVFATVGTPQDLIDAVLGDGGLTSGGAAPRVLVDCSTISADVSGADPRAARRAGHRSAGRPGDGQSQSGQCGQAHPGRVRASRPPLTLARPYLDLLGAGATYVGEGELARTVKLCHNLFLGVVTQSLAEVTILAEKSGVSREAFLSCLNKSVMGSPFTRYKSPAFVNLDFHPTFTATLLRKDFDLGLAAGREHEVPLPVAALVHQMIQSLIGRGYGEQDFAALIELEAQSAGLQLASENSDISDGLDQPDGSEANAVP